MLKSTPAVIVEGRTSIRMSVGTWTVTLTKVLLPVLRLLPTASAAVKSSATNICRVYCPGATLEEPHVNVALPSASVTAVPRETFVLPKSQM